MNATTCDYPNDRVFEAGRGRAKRLRPAGRPGPERRRRGWLSASTGAGLALLLAALPSPAQAQAVTLVSNTGQTVDTTSSGHFQAQCFGTGAHTRGYVVSEVELRLDNVPSGASTSVRIREDDGGEPGNLVATLTNPVTLSPTSLNTFTAPEGTILDAGATYWISVNEGISGRVSYSQTDGDGQTGETGWTICDDRQWRSSETGSWASDAEALVIAIKGSARAENTPATGAPAITGSARVGQTLRPSTSGISDANGLEGVGFRYAWYEADGSRRLEDALSTTSTLELEAADLGKRIVVVVGFTDEDGYVEQLESAPVLVRAAMPPATCPAFSVPAGREQVWTGIVTVGERRDLGNNPEWHGWLGSIGNLSDTDFDIGMRTLTIDSVRVVASSLIAGIGARGTLSFSLEDEVPAAALARLRLHVCGETYTWTDSQYVGSASRHTYSWPTAGLDWSGLVGSTRQLYLTQVANSPATGAPSVSGTARVGSTVTASTAGIRDANGLGTFSYQWTREDEDGSDQEDISGATGSSYTLASDDNGKRVRVKVSFTDGAGFEEELTSPAFPMRGTVAMAPPEMTDPTDIWSATLNPGIVLGVAGCFESGSGLCSESTVLSDDDFDFGGTGYEFKEITLRSGGRLDLIFDQAMPAAASSWQLTVTKGGSTVTLDFSDDVNASGRSVSWNSTGLSWEAGDSISLAIRDPGTGDVTPPMLRAGFGNVPPTGTQLSLRFNEILKADGPPMASAFRVTADDSRVTVTSIISGGPAVVVLNLSPIIQQGQIVTLSYFDPTPDDDANAIQDTAGNDVATFEHFAVVNGSRFTGVPGKPTGLTATAQDADTADGETEIALSWTEPTDIGEAPIDGYRIEWSADGNAPWTELVADTGTTATTYTDEELGSEETRHYRVSARNSFGAGSASDSASATTADIEGPVLTGGQVISTGDGVLLEFDETLDLRAGPPNSVFTVTADGVEIGFEAATLIVTNPMRVSLINLSPVIRRGQAVVVTYTDPTSGDDTAAIQDDDGNDAASFTTGQDDVPAVTNNSNVAPTAPGQVTGLEAEAGSEGTSIVLTWERPADNGGRVIASYRIEVCEMSCDQDTNFAQLVATHNEMADGAIVLSYEHMGLPAGATRHYRVAARNSVNLGAWSEKAMASSVHPGAPDAPTGLTATAQDSDTADGETEIALSWTSPADEGDTNITGYRIEWSADGTTDWTELEDDTGSRATTFIDRRLASETTRHYRVFAINNQGRSLPSNVDDATTADVDGPEPQSASVPEAGTSVAIVFNEALDETAGRLPQASRFAVTAADGAVFTVASVAVDDKTVTLTLASDSATIRTGQALTVVYTDPSTNDETAGVIQDDDGNDAASFTLGPSETVTVTNGSTQAVGDPGVPRNVATVGGGDSITVSWDAPLETGGQSITRYAIQISLNGSNFTQTVFVDHPGTSYVTTGLSVGDERWYRVRVQAGTGSNARYSPYSGIVQGITLHPDAPGAPTGLTATPGLPSPRDGTTQIRLSWTKPADEGTPNISGYRIEWSADGTTDWTELEANTGTRATSYIDPGLESETTRFYRVFAINSSGRGLASNVDDATTADIAAPVPQSASVPTSGESIAIVFDEGLDETTANLPQASRFAVTAGDGAVFRVGTVEVDDMTVTLNLHADSPTIRTGQALTVVYTDPSTNDETAGVIQDDDGNDAADFTLGPSETVMVTNGSDQAVGAPGVPRNVRAESGGDDRIVVTWDAPADTGGRAITGYRVEVSDQGPGGPFTQLVGNHNAKNSAGRFEYVNTGLSVGQQRWYRVTGRNGPNNADLGMNSQVRQGVVDKKGDVVLSVDPVSVAEGGTATWTVTATTDEGEAPESGLSMQVTVTSADGTATAPGDYAAVDETVTITEADFRRTTVDGDIAYVATKTGTIAVVNDVTVEGEERFTVSMEVGSGGTGWVTGTDEVEVAIEDSDGWSVAVEANPATMVEGETREIRLTARILHVEAGGTPSVPPTDTCVVPFDVRVDLEVGGTATGEGTDYTLEGSTPRREIEACEAAAEWRVTLTALVDTVDDDAETVTFTPELDSTPEIAPVSLDAGTVTIGEEPGVVLGVGALGVEEGESASYTVVLTSRPSGTVTLTPSVSGDMDVMVSPARLRFDGGNWALPQSVTVRADHDEDDEDDTATVNHRVSGADYGAVAVGQVRVNVRDDDKSFGKLRVQLARGVSRSAENPAPSVHYGEKFQIALHWTESRTWPWAEPHRAIGADRAIRVTGATVRPQWTPGYGRYTQHVLILELTPESAGTDVTLVLEPLDCSTPDPQRPNPRALCARLDNGSGPITGLAERVRWTVRGIDAVPAAPRGLTIGSGAGDEAGSLVASFDTSEAATKWRVEVQAAGGSWTRPKRWQDEKNHPPSRVEGGVTITYPDAPKTWGEDFRNGRHFVVLDRVAVDGDWEVRARWENRYGAGPWAEAATTDGPALAAPRNVALTQGPDGRSVSLSWSAPAASSGRVARYQYKLARPGEAGEWTDIPNSGPGAANARSFAVEGLARTWELTAQVRAVDRSGRAGEASAEVQVPAAAPAVVTGGVRLTSDPGLDGRYAVGDAIDVAVRMTRPVRLEGTAPTVRLEIGSARREATLRAIGEGDTTGTGDTLRFRYTVVEGDEDTDGIRIPSGGLALNGGRLLDASATGNGARARFRLSRAVVFPEHLVQGVLAQVEKIERLGNQVWVYFTHDLRSPLARTSSVTQQFGVSYSVSQKGVPEVVQAQLVRGRGWPNACARSATDCRVVRLTLGQVWRTPEGYRRPRAYAAPLRDETVQISYTPNPHFAKYRLRDVAGNETKAFGRTTAVPLSAGDSPIMSVSDARGYEQVPHRRTLHFNVRLTPAATREVTVRYTTQDGRVDGDQVTARGYLSATENVDYRREAGTLVFAPGDTAKQVRVQIIDDRVEDDREVFALVLSDLTGPATFGDPVGQGIIYNDELLSATFEKAPESHDGTSAFTLELAFNEPVTASADALRDHALSVTGGEVTAVAAVGTESKRFQLTVEPAGADDVTVQIGPRTDCDAEGAVCTAEQVGLERKFEATVAYGGTATLAAPTVSGAPQVGATLEASFEETPGGTLAWQWLRGDEEIAEAESATYVPVEADVGAALAVRVTRGEETATSEATPAVWAAPANPPLAVGEEELLSTTLTLGSSDEFPVKIAGYNRFVGTPFGDMAATSFEDGDTSRTIDLLMVNEMGRLSVATGTELPDAAGLAVYWNGHRSSGLERSRASPGRDVLGAATPMPRETYLRTTGGQADGIKVAVSIRRAHAVVSVTDVSVTTDPGENGTWDEDETVSAEVRFSAPVTVTGGPPTLAILLDGNRHEATYSGGSGTDTLTFAWSVTEAEAGAKRARVASNGLVLNGATLSAGANTVVDIGFAVAPWVTGVVIAPDASEDREWTPGESIEAHLTFSEAVTVEGGSPWIQIRIGGFAHPGTLGYASGSGTTTLVFSTEVPGGAAGFTGLAVIGDSLEANGARIVSATSGLAAELTHDGTEPTAAPGDAGPVEPLTATFQDVPTSHDGSAFRVSLVFDGDVPAAATAAIAAEGGEVRQVEAVDARRWRVTVAPAGTDTAVTVTIRARDCAETGAVCTANGRGLAADVSATVAARTGETPFRVDLEGLPEEHDGESDIVFRVVFNKRPAGFSYTVLRDQTIRIRQGGTTLTPQVKRVLSGDDRNTQWRITVAPGGKEDITVAIGPFSQCSDPGAICTEAQEVVSNHIDETILGPPGLSVADARVYEAPGAMVDFTVTLGRASRATVHVDYATSDGTAVAGDDYAETSGTLAFAPGETEHTVSVLVYQDGHDEGEETFTLTLSNPQGGNAWLKDATATGTIENSDAMPKAWLARFGRTVAEQVLEAVEGRFASERSAGTQVSVAGQSFGTSADDITALEEQTAKEELQALSAWLGGESDDRQGREVESRQVSGRDLLTGTAFTLTDGNPQGGYGAVWGRGAVSRFDGREGDLTLEGEVGSAMLGADLTRDRHTLGLMFSHSRGEGSYEGEGTGTVESTLTGLYPYGRYELSKRVSLWGVAGYGEGSLTLTPEGQDPLETDMDLMMGAIGARGLAREAPGGEGLELTVTSDAMGVRTTSEKIEGLAGAEADVTRVRLGLEGAWRSVPGEGGGQFTPTAEIGLRHDGGDAETGFGLDVGGGFTWAHPTSGLSGELRARGLLTHEAGGFRDRGIAGSLGFDPRPESDRGFSLTLTQSMGAQASGGMDALLGHRHLGGLAGNGDELGNRQLEIKMGYGFAVFGDRFTSTPEAGLGLSDNHRELSVGWRLGSARNGPVSMELGVEGTRRDAANALMLNAQASW